MSFCFHPFTFHVYEACALKSHRNLGTSFPPSPQSCPTFYLFGLAQFSLPESLIIALSSLYPWSLLLPFSFLSDLFSLAISSHYANQNIHFPFMNGWQLRSIIWLFWTAFVTSSNGQRFFCSISQELKHLVLAFAIRKYSLGWHLPCNHLLSKVKYNNHRGQVPQTSLNPGLSEIF